jgi:hypothetical protein
MKEFLNKIYDSPVAQLALLIGVIVLFIYTLPASKAVVPQAQRVGFFAPFDKGQKVAVKETPQGFEITASDFDMGYIITEVGSDYIVVEDMAKVTETRIPMYSIRSIKTIKVKGK